MREVCCNSSLSSVLSWAQAALQLSYSCRLPDATSSRIPARVALRATMMWDEKSSLAFSLLTYRGFPLADFCPETWSVFTLGQYVAEARMEQPGLRNRVSSSAERWTVLSAGRRHGRICRTPDRGLEDVVSLPSSASNLGGVGRGTLPFCASVFQSIKWVNDAAFFLKHFQTHY